MDHLDLALFKKCIGFVSFPYLKTEAQAASETYYFTINQVTYKFQRRNITSAKQVAVVLKYVSS